MDYSNRNVKLAAKVVQSFVAVNKILAKFTQQNAKSLGLKVLQMGILNTLYSSPEITLKEVAEKLQLSKSTVSVNVDDLVNAGLINRKTSEEDRREINLKLTFEGETLARKSCQNASSYKAMSSALEKISEEKVQCLLDTHKELLILLQKYEL